MAGYVLCWFLGIERMGAAVPTLIALCLPPVLVTVVALLRHQETLDFKLALVLAAAVAGTMLVVHRHSESPASANQLDLLLGILFSLASAILYAGFTLISGRLSSRLGAGQATTCLTIVAAVVMSLSSFYRPLRWPVTLPPQAW